MKKILTALGMIVLTAGGALAADKLLKGDQFVIAGVHFPQPFKTTSGQVLKAGVYDLKVVSDGTESILIGLLKGGKQVGQVKGTVKALPVDQGVTIHPSGGPGGALPVDQGVKLQPAGALGPTPRPSDPKTFRQLGFTPASAVSFFGGNGKIASTSRSQPAAILPYIEFECPPGPPNIK